MTAADTRLQSPPPPPLPLPRTFLPEVQALRAVAVMLVVIYHFWPHRLPGGYVGVDVFFVISGFLITSHLHRELVARGTIRLGVFYARRARRLLPAALLVLVTTVAASLLFLPAPRWASTAHEVLASTFYVQNWFLATKAVQYSALDDAASPVQHFWSLSVEEQFYLLWPPLILLLLLASRRLPLRRHSLLLPGIAVLMTASLAYSVYATATDRAAAYFVTPTRIWELGVGAMLALGMTRRTAGRGDRGPRASMCRTIALRWAGITAVLLSALFLSGASAFPGYIAAVPVLGTAAVIAAGNPERRDPLSVLFNLRPVQFTGNVSYALYLWHWPVIVTVPFALGHPLPAAEKVVLLAACFGLAWATKRLVEDPPQRWRLLVARPALTAVLTVMAMLAVSGAAGLQLLVVSHREDVARAHLAAAQSDPCFGAAAMQPGSGCSDPYRPPAPAILTADDQPWFEDPACVASETPIHQVTCRFGAEPPTRRVALVGDSHAEHWRGALHEIARELNWQLVEILKGGCPATDAKVLTYNGGGVDTAACHAWGQQVDRILASEQFDDILTSSYAIAYDFDAPRGDSTEAGTNGFLTTWSEWARTGAQVIVLRDIPTTGNRTVPECLAAHPDAPLACARPRQEAVQPDPATMAAERGGSDAIRLVDLTASFCDDRTCYAVIGGAQVYWDNNHMTAQYSRSLAPYLYDALS